MSKGCQYPIVTLAVIISVTILELVAMLIMHYNGVALSAVVGSLIAIAMKRQDIEYKLRRLGSWK